MWYVVFRLWIFLYLAICWFVSSILFVYTATRNRRHPYTYTKTQTRIDTTAQHFTHSKWVIVCVENPSQAIIQTVLSDGNSTKKKRRNDDWAYTNTCNPNSRTHTLPHLANGAIEAGKDETMHNRWETRHG